MGFHFGEQGWAGEVRSKKPNTRRNAYNYHAILYSMSCNELPSEPEHQNRRSAPAVKRPTVPPRQSSLPVLDGTPNQRMLSSERRSMSSMNSTLPLALQPGVRSAFDFSSWIEDTIEELQHPYNSKIPAHKEPSDSLNDVPWMQEEQDTTSNSLRPRKYRETPVYSNPGSSLVSFPYCGCEGLGSAQYNGHARSVGADLDINSPSPLFSKNNSPRCSGATLVNPLDRNSSESSATFGRPRTASGATTKSTLSLKSRGNQASETAWLKPLPAIPVPTIGDIISPTVFSPSTTEGCPSMPCTPGLVLDAYTARLSSGRPTGIEVSQIDTSRSTPAHSRNVSVESAVSSISSLSMPTLHPLEMDHIAAYMEGSPISPPTPLDSPAKVQHRTIGRPTATPGAMPIFHSVDMLSPLSGFKEHSISFTTSSEKQPFVSREPSASAVSGIVADISASVQEFPATMLCLDTPCIVAIRRNMLAAQNGYLSPPPSPVSPASPSATETCFYAATVGKISHFRRQRRSLRRSRNVNELLSMPWPRSFRAGTPPSPFHLPPPEPITDSVPDRYSPTMDLLSYYRTDTIEEECLDTDTDNKRAQLNDPDLSAIAAIFPGSDAWWQATLYGHLIAYNYITDLNNTPLETGRRRNKAVPAKAARTMGIPSIALISEGGNGYADVLEDLESCMVGVMKSMLGQRDGGGRLSRPGGELGRGEIALVRALSLVVRSVEVSSAVGGWL